MHRMTGRFGGRPRRWGAALLAAAALGAGPSALAQERPKGDVEVTVEVEGGKPFQSCTVFVKNQEVRVAEAGRPVRATGVPQGRVAVLADARVAPGVFKGTVRAMGVAEVAVNPGGVARVKLVVKPVVDLDAFCLGCHPSGRDKSVRPQPGQIIRDVHASNQPLGEKYLKQLRKYNETVERLKKEKKPHNYPIVTEERTVIVAGKETKQIFYTCESCHTLHIETPHTDNARAPFRLAADLCVGCHD